VLGFAVLVVSIGVVGPARMLENLLISMTDTTEFSEGYTDKAFRHVSAGDELSVVLNALGEPLNQRDATPYIAWLYSPEDQAVRAFKKSGEYPDISGSFTILTFTEDGTFDGAFGQLSTGGQPGLMVASGLARVGDGHNTLAIKKADIDTLKSKQATREVMEAKYGKPDGVFASPVVTWLYFSRSAKSGNYRQRMIGLDRDGKVCRKIDTIYWD
jgi:hypothetical protein